MVVEKESKVSSRIKQEFAGNLVDLPINKGQAIH